MKYELIKESKTMFEGREIYRIRSLKDFGDVKAGDIGGWVCSYNNLSQEGNCWIYNEAKCLDEATVYNNAIMFNNAIMYDNAIMFDNAAMCDNSKMYGNSAMCDNSKMYGNAKLENCTLYSVVSTKFKNIFQYVCTNRILTAILTEQNEILYSVGCQIEITKETFIDRIYNDCKVEGKGLEEYPHRKEYLDIIDMAENYLMKFI